MIANRLGVKPHPSLHPSVQNPHKISGPFHFSPVVFHIRPFRRDPRIRRNSQQYKLAPFQCVVDILSYTPKNPVSRRHGQHAGKDRAKFIVVERPLSAVFDIRARARHSRSFWEGAPHKLCFMDLVWKKWIPGCIGHWRKHRNRLSYRETAVAKECDGVSCRSLPGEGGRSDRKARGGHRAKGYLSAT